MWSSSYCEDFPCCGHEAGDCNGQKYGSDENIIASAMLHADCEHSAGYCWVAEREEQEKEDEEYERQMEAMS